MKVLYHIVKMTRPEGPRAFLSLSVVPEHMNLTVTDLQSEHVAAHFHVAGHGFVVDVIGQ
ncbi:hypothetical protein D3C77_618560 [compost metagenome]